MKALITGGLGVNGAVTARLMVQDSLRPVLMEHRTHHRRIEHGFGRRAGRRLVSRFAWRRYRGLYS